jgi:hypothetical protein
VDETQDWFFIKGFLMEYCVLLCIRKKFPVIKFQTTRESTWEMRNLGEMVMAVWNPCAVYFMEFGFFEFEVHSCVVTLSAD